MLRGVCVCVWYERGSSLRQSRWKSYETPLIRGTLECVRLRQGPAFPRKEKLNIRGHGWIHQLCFCWELPEEVLGLLRNGNSVVGKEHGRLTSAWEGSWMLRWRGKEGLDGCEATAPRLKKDREHRELDGNRGLRILFFLAGGSGAFACISVVGLVLVLDLLVGWRECVCVASDSCSAACKFLRMP